MYIHTYIHTLNKHVTPHLHRDYATLAPRAVYVYVCFLLFVLFVHAKPCFECSGLHRDHTVSFQTTNLGKLAQTGQRWSKTSGASRLAETRLAQNCFNWLPLSRLKSIPHVYIYIYIYIYIMYMFIYIYIYTHIIIYRERGWGKRPGPPGGTGSRPRAAWRAPPFCQIAAVFSAYIYIYI